MKHRNGDWVWIENRDTVFTSDDQGKPLQLIGSAVDITDRKVVEESLLELQQETNDAHQRLLTVLESIDMGIYVADIDTYEVLYTNGCTQKIHGSIVGEKCWKVLQAGQTGPCLFCNNDRLIDEKGRPTGVQIRETYNGNVDR